MRLDYLTRKLEAIAFKHFVPQIVWENSNSSWEILTFSGDRGIKNCAPTSLKISSFVLCTLHFKKKKSTERNSLLPRAPLDLKSYLRLWLLWFFRLYHSAKKENHGICINSFNFLYWFRKFMASYITNSGLLTSLIKILDNSTIALQRPNARRKRRHS